MIFPNAMNWIDCSGNQWGAWFTAGCMAIVCVQYLVICYLWMRFDNRRISLSLIGIFFLCMLCGYATTVAASFDPAVDIAYSFRILSLPVLIVANKVFIVCAWRVAFQAKDKAILDQIARHAKKTGQDRVEVLDAILEIAQSANEIIDRYKDKP